MVIQYFGDGCFRLQSGELSLLLNPTNNRLKADIVLKTLALTDSASDGAGAPAGEISFPGEYEIKGISIQGWGVDGESSAKFIKAIYMVEWEEMRFLFLGHISRLLPPVVLEEVGEVDVVFVPTGDPHFLAAADAAKLIKQVSPKVIIPAYFKSANELVKAVGVKPEEVEKLVFRKKDLAAEKTRLVVLAAKN